jgi:hypothetical protein
MRKSMQTGVALRRASNCHFRGLVEQTLVSPLPVSQSRSVSSGKPSA